ncbi:hypothetical protein H206_02506 [Candidatus Electrothrix aarhusensis]|uniref:Uncharacterized protein n=1 Tax=Candidatus Electrothrix aarhusensis TaxID=1859131 RepID=A0A3S3QGW5_9BACT|nr:hypothetical protein H206_02506 [Candidatus Electrothrix aarhusensis]
MSRFVALLLFALLTSCSVHSQQEVVLLDYNDFGPQIIAREVIGMEWWQWQDHGDSDAAAVYPVKVAVYRDIPVTEVEQKYPVEPEQKKDFRYLEYQRALDFLDEKIAENIQENVTERLKATRKKIVSQLGK